jgi:hypothetical protein
VARWISCQGVWLGGTPAAGGVPSGPAPRLIRIVFSSMLSAESPMLVPLTGLGTPSAAHQQCAGEVVRQAGSGGDGMHRDLAVGL